VRELSWIEIALQNPDGSPLANEPYRIKLPDGALREGKLGANGKIRLNDIPVGECEISFPNHDA
jgi:type VI secretion system secreted protein VgrG